MTRTTRSGATGQPGSSRRARPRRVQPLRAEGHAETRSSSRPALIDAAVHRFLVDHSLQLLRWALGGVFVYFGVLKLFPGQSPAESLVRETIRTMTFGVVAGRAGVIFTGLIEVALGLLLVTGRLRRLTIYVLGLELLGILAPLVLLPARLFDLPLTPTLEGQYVIKDITLVAAGLVLAVTMRGGRLTRGPHSAQPTSIDGEADEVSADEKLRMVLESLRADHDAQEAARAHGISAAEFRRWRDEFLDGAVAHLASPPDEN